MAAQHPGTWAKVLATAGFDETLVKDIGIFVERVEEPASAMDEQGRLCAERLARFFAAPEREARTLVLTERDLSAGNCSWVFGYADQRNGVAVISTCRISAPTDAQKTAVRLRRLIAHERGHLEGLAHCSTPGCAMHEKRDAADLDSSSSRTCGRCPPRFRFLSFAFAIVSCMLLFLFLDQVGKALKPARISPFTVTHAQSNQHARILFDGKPLIELAELTSAQDLGDQLNAAYHDVRKARFRIKTSSSGSATIRLNGADLLEITTAESGSEPPVALAEKWRQRFSVIINGKGSPAESCPMCHIARHSEVIEYKALSMRR